MIKVERKNGETADALIKRFKKKCSRAGLKDEINKRKAYTKPSDKRRARRKAAIKRRSKG